MKILIVEDSKILRENLDFLLKKFHFLSEFANDWEEALQKISLQKYEAIVLDNNMPIMTGEVFLKKMRKNCNTTPVIVLTSDSWLQNKLSMFDLWADDYLTKPFEIEELVARLKALGKRKENISDSEKNFHGYSINFSKWKVWSWETEILLPHKQYLILEILVKNMGYAQSKTKIMEYVWGEQEENLELSSTTLESHIYAIRKKLGKNVIETRKWVGYIIEN